MGEMKSHIEIAIASIKCFTDDGTLDLSELNFLLGLALRDDRVDEEGMGAQEYLRQGFREGRDVRGVAAHSEGPEDVRYLVKCISFM